MATCCNGCRTLCSSLCAQHRVSRAGNWKMSCTSDMGTICLAGVSMMRGWPRWACPPAATPSLCFTSSPPSPHSCCYNQCHTSHEVVPLVTGLIHIFWKAYRPCFAVHGVFNLQSFKYCLLPSPHQPCCGYHLQTACAPDMPLTGAAHGRQESALSALVALDFLLLCANLFRACWACLACAVSAPVDHGLLPSRHYVPSKIWALHEFLPNLSVCTLGSTRVQPV